MSASTEKKNRQAAREAGTDKKMLAAQEAEKKARVTKRKWTIGVIAVVLCVALILLLSSPLMSRITTAETIGSKNYSPADVKYVIANTKANINYNLYANYLGQEAADEALASSLRTSMIQTAALLQYAKDNGIALTEREKTAIGEAVNDQLDQMREAAKENKVSLSRYMGFVYGTGVNRGVIEKGLSESILANKAYFSKFLELSFTQEELDAYNAEQEANGDVFSYAYYLVTTGEDRSDEEAKAAAEALKTGFAESSADAENLEAAFNDLLAEEIPEASATVRSDVQAASIDALYHDWMLEDARQAGDIDVFPAADGSHHQTSRQLRRRLHGIGQTGTDLAFDTRPRLPPRPGRRSSWPTGKPATRASCPLRPLPICSPRTMAPAATAACTPPCVRARWWRSSTASALPTTPTATPPSSTVRRRAPMPATT